MSSSLNGITAYENDDEKRIRNEDIAIFNNNDLKLAKERIKKLVDSKMDEIIAFINNIPTSFNGIDVMSDLRKKYYCETFIVRFNRFLN